MANEIGSIAMSEGTNLAPLSAKLVTLSFSRKGPAARERRTVAERVDECRQSRRNIGLPGEEVDDEYRAAGDQGRPFLAGKAAFPARNAHCDEEKADDRHRQERPTALAGALIALHPIAGGAEDSERKPGQRMRPNLAAQSLQNVDDGGEDRQHDGKNAERIPPPAQHLHDDAPSWRCRAVGET